jgi:hypothetical protein
MQNANTALIVATGATNDALFAFFILHLALLSEPRESEASRFLFRFLLRLS